MRIIETKVYTFDELSDQAKEKAIDKLREMLSYEYFWANDALASLKAFADEIGIHITDYSIDWGCSGRSYIKYSGNHNGRFIKKDLTGYCMDYPLINEWNKTRDIDSAISSWLNDCEQDYLYQSSDEYVIDYIHSNQYEFTEDGEIV